MKSRLTWILCCSACVLGATSFAQESDGSLHPQAGRYDTNQPSATTTTDRDETRSKEFCRSKDLVGANVKDSQGQKLGEIDELLVSPKTGESIATIGVGSGRYALVPVRAFNVGAPHGVLRNADVTLNTTKDALQAGPTVSKSEWQNLDNPSFTRRIYSHYHVQAPSGMGGAGSFGGSSSGSGSSEQEGQTGK